MVNSLLDAQKKIYDHGKEDEDKVLHRYALGKLVEPAIFEMRNCGRDEIEVRGLDILCNTARFTSPDHFNDHMDRSRKDIDDVGGRYADELVRGELSEKPSEWYVNIWAAGRNVIKMGKFKLGLYLIVFIIFLFLVGVGFYSFGIDWSLLPKIIEHLQSKQ